MRNLGKTEAIATEIAGHLAEGAHVYTEQGLIYVLTKDDRCLWYSFASSDYALEVYNRAKGK